MSQQNLDINRAMAHVKSSAVQPTYGYGAGKPMAGFNAGIPIVRNGAGDYELTLLEDTSIADVTIIANPSGPLAASGLVAIGTEIVGTPSKRLRVTILQEGAAGAASTLVDHDFDIVVLKYPQT